jgi:hypothetical protein
MIIDSKTVLRIKLAVFIVAACLSFASPTQAAEVRCVDGSKVTISEEYAKIIGLSEHSQVIGWCKFHLITGEIAKGDYEKVRASLAQNYKIIPLFYLHSPGGDVDEAIKIGRLFRKYLIQVSAPSDYGDGLWLPVFNSLGGDLACRGSNCTCASACALIWFGAVTRQGTVGLHRPRFLDEQFKMLPPAEASIAYRRLLDKITDYLNEMEVPNPMADAMVATESSDIQWIDETMNGLDHPPSFAEWSAASCGPFPHNELHAFAQFAAAKAPLTPIDATLQNMLGEKLEKYYSCFNTLTITHVNQLPPP